MKTQVEFRSGKFAAYDGEEERINPGLWGQRLGEYLKEKLGAEGVETSELIPEDWGWCLPVENDTFRLWIGCGHAEEHADAYRCFVEPSKPTVRRWFRTIDTTEAVGRVVSALASILETDPDIRDVNWV